MEHPWFCYTPQYNPCTVFLLYEGNTNVLPIKRVTADSITQDLISSLNHYIAEAVVLDPQEQHVSTCITVSKVQETAFLYLVASSNSKWVNIARAQVRLVLLKRRVKQPDIQLTNSCIM